MPLLIVRHARAGKRWEWEGDDRERPLDKKGRRQAEGLVEQAEADPEIAAGLHRLAPAHAHDGHGIDQGDKPQQHQQKRHIARAAMAIDHASLPSRPGARSTIKRAKMRNR